METGMAVTLPDNLSADNYGCLMATVYPVSGAWTKASGNGWTVAVASPDFSTSPATAAVTVKGDNTLSEGDQALLSVILTYKDGTQVTATRLVKFGVLGDKPLEDAAVGDYYMGDGTLVDRNVELTDAQKSGCIGIVFYAGRHANDGSSYTVPGTVHGYVAAIENVEIPPYGTCIWSTEAIDVPGVDNEHYNAPKASMWNGFGNTQAIMSRPGFSVETYPAVFHAVNYGMPAPETSSGWFLPSAAQLAEIYENSGIADSLREVNTAVSSYWSSSECTRDVTEYVLCYVTAGNGYLNLAAKNRGGYNYWVRSVLVF